MSASPRLRGWVFVGVLALSMVAGPRAPLAFAAGSVETTSSTAPLPGGDIIPAPNSGRAPESSGDRGGSAQVLLLVVMVGGLATIGGLAYRSARRARPAATGGDDPA